MTLSFDRDGRDWPNRGASRFVRSGRIEWHVQEMGAGPVALLIHGTGAATHSWRGVMPLLAQRYRVIAIDLPGHGFTRGRPAGGLSIEAMRDALAALMAAMEIEPEVMIGHSAGAALALAESGARPRAIIGTGAALTPFPGVAAAIFPALAKLMFANPFTPHIFAQIARRPGEVERFLKRSTGSAIDAEGIAAYATLFADPAHCGGAVAMMACWRLETVFEALPRIETPVLLIHGEDDRSVPIASARAAAERLPRGQVIAIPHLGHLAHEERPDIVTGHITAFIERVSQSEAA